eukprot:TRINITY_DN111954_c0_g1_i1.p1 TRINITY_DN111954_c0_g1~~TRINITY_DN111954_c0_g1_i1.p1  ORF type:complete len:195 (+),score=27.11 TRINITY_DN111954_c0_g1_i1:68-652(+)
MVSLSDGEGWLYALASTVLKLAFWAGLIASTITLFVMVVAYWCYLRPVLNTWKKRKTPPTLREFATSGACRTLAASVLIDTVGGVIGAVPFLGFFLNFLWAPVSAVLIYQVHGTTIGSAAGLLEQLVPFVCFLPTASLVWVREEDNAVWALQGSYSLWTWLFSAAIQEPGEEEEREGEEPPPTKISKDKLDSID